MSNSARASLVGRDEDLEQLERAIDGAGIVTLVGAPGIGKTSLAAELAATRAREFPGGVWHVDLAAASSVADVCAAVAAATGEVPVSPPERGLLILDHFDPVVDTAAETVARWAVAGSQLRILVTSRERLRVAGETLVRVRPLSPAAAVELYCRCAATSPDAPGVAELAERLDRNPLAIELAAARANVLSPEQALARLDARFELLAHARHGAAAHHASLRTAIDWSWDRLAPATRNALAQCAVFDGAFAIDAADGVLDEPALPSLQALADMSLISARSRGGRVLFACSESVREYCRARSDVAEARETGRRRYRGLYERLAREARDPAVVAAELDNYLAVCTAYFAEGDVTTAAEIAISLESCVVDRAPLAGYAARLDALVPVSAELSLEQQARMWLCRARVRWKRGELEPALDDCIAARERATRADCLAVAAQTQWVEGNVLRALGRRTEALAALEQGKAIARRIGDAAVEARLVAAVGVVHHVAMELDRALSQLKAARDLAVSCGDAPYEGKILIELGHVFLCRRELGDAQAAYESALDRLRATGPHWDEATALTNLGIIRQERGRLDEAETALREALSILEDLGGAEVLVAGVCGYLGGLHHELGRYELAQSYYRRALCAYRGAGDPRYQGLFWSALGAALAAQGQVDAARDAFERADTALSPITDRGFRAAAELHHGHLLLAAGRRADVEALLERSRADASLQQDDVRFARRLLDRAVMTGALVVAEDHSWFAAPRSPRASLTRRPLLRRLLEALVGHRVRAPGEPISSAELIAAGWPGERIDPRAASNRLHVSLTYLRKMGLSDALGSVEDGYALDPDLPVVLRRPDLLVDGDGSQIEAAGV